MNKILKRLVILAIIISSIMVGYLLVQLMLIPLHLCFMDDYNFDPYIRNLSGKDSAFIKTSSYFMTLVPSEYKETHMFLYARNGRRKRTFILRPNSTVEESIFLRNISYNSAEVKAFLQYIGIKKEQLDTLDSYMTLINCKSIYQPIQEYGLPNVVLNIHPNDHIYYCYYDSISIERHYCYDSISNQKICDSLIVKKGPHILINTIDGL